MTIEHYLGKNFHEYRKAAGLPKITDKEAQKILEEHDKKLLPHLKDYLKILPSYKKYKNLKIHVDRDLKKFENIALMDGGELIDNRFPIEPKYSRIQRIINYFKN